MAAHFTESEWSKINALLRRKGTGEFGLPTRRNDSLVIGSFNIRKLGARDKKSDGAFNLLKRSQRNKKARRSGAGRWPG